MFNNIVSVTHSIISQKVDNGDFVLDATVGKGNDTCYLAEQVGGNGKVYGFDIQDFAIKYTKIQLKEQNLSDRVNLFNIGHEKLAEYLPKDITLKLAIFNLGYLPAGDKTIITHGNTTISAIKQILPLLQTSGIILIATYISHEGGMAEYQSVYDFTKNLPQKDYSVGHFEFINQKNLPPKLIMIERR